MNLKTPYIIADVGSNWKRTNSEEENLAIALRHINDGARCGVSAVKFQYYNHKELYGVHGDNTYSLPYHFLARLAAECQLRKIDFLCTAFSEEGVKLVDPFVPIHKIASCEMSHLKLIDAALATEKAVVISTGCHHLSEIRAVQTYIGRTREDKVIFLECVAAYPAKAQDYNFSYVKDFKKFGVSDHTVTNTLALTAVGFGATVFEKHFDALKINTPNTDTPDAPFSLGLVELSQYVSQIEEASRIQRTETKMTQISEEPVKLSALRRLKITKPVRSSDVLEYGVNFGVYRSLEKDTRAANPLSLSQFEGKRVKREMQVQEGLWFDDLE